MKQLQRPLLLGKRDPWKMSSDPIELARALAMMALAGVILISLNSCVTRKQINAAIFIEQQIPARYCLADSPLWNYGVSRILVCTPELVQLGHCLPGQARTEEFMPYCDPLIKNYGAIRKDELEQILKQVGIN